MGGGGLERWRQSRCKKTGRGATFRVGGAEEIERNGDSGGASNILFRCVASPRFLPHLHILPFFSPPPNIPSPISLFRLLPRALPLFSKSLKGGHEGDNANTDPLNREWEEDSCWR